MAEIINISHERLLARTLALRAARQRLVAYSKMMDAMESMVATFPIGDEAEAIVQKAIVFDTERETLKKTLHQIDEALK